MEVKYCGHLTSTEGNWQCMLTSILSSVLVRLILFWFYLDTFCFTLLGCLGSNDVHCHHGKEKNKISETQEFQKSNEDNKLVALKQKLDLTTVKSGQFRPGVYKVKKFVNWPKDYCTVTFRLKLLC